MAAHSFRRALFHTPVGRIVVAGVATRVLVSLVRSLGVESGLLGVLDTIAGLALAGAVTYLLFHVVLFAKRHLLWRVRRRLILSYVFIGFVPALLIATFFLLTGFLLFYSFSSYLVQSRLRALTERARFVAETVVLEIQRTDGRNLDGIVSARGAVAAEEWPGLSIVVVQVSRECEARDRASASAVPIRLPAAAGPWAHVRPTSDIPAWIPCAGFSGVLAYSAGPTAGDVDENAGIVLRAAAFPESPRPAYGVVVDLPVLGPVLEQLRRETGVEVVSVSAVRDEAHEVRPLAGRANSNAGPAKAYDGSGGWLGNLPSPVAYRDWSSGGSGTLMVSTQLRIGELYDRISSAQGLGSRSFGQALLLALFVIGGLFVVIQILALGAGLALAKSITGSVHELFGGTERVRRGDFTHRVAVKTRDQLGELAESFNSMTASIEGLLQEAAEKKRLEEELRFAREIQMSLLPQGPLVMPGLSVMAVCVPAREVGGDYYDFLALDEDRMAVLIADVSGKGTSAALYMAELKGLMLSLSRIHSSPRALMVAANRIIADNLDARSFITMTYAVVDLKAMTMTFARAGHTPLFRLPGGAAPRPCVERLVPDGLVLGLKLDHGEMFDRLLEERTIPIGRGDLYLFFTDGITEAMNAGDDCFGEARLCRIVEDHTDLPSEQLGERVLAEIRAFAGPSPQHDDMTLILLRIGAPRAETVATGSSRGEAGVQP